ncbi:MAG: BlaI/MecI/CopY family transcriptional regulator [Candidatus Latescibacteria bacterium]|jgi:BlaI family transcriptional regulator, penicillinase repressor|nr:BlaI/MecI/CopY family transcriptional regulator [Candidatus Latescibacterota bacterium]
MQNIKPSTFTKVELEFMQIIWDHSEATSEDIQNALAKKDRHITDGGIRRILSILMKKGHLTRNKRGRSFLYKAIIHKEYAEKNIIHDLLDRAFSGSIPHMVSTLINSRDISDDEMKEVKKIITERERKRQK